jgi:hypothetical protein
MTLRTRLFFAIIFFCSFHFLEAQVRLPQPSPTVKVIQNFGVSEVTLDYSRPSLRGRSFGEGNLNYFGKFWRTGANSGTNITFGSEVMINGQKIAAGKYGLYSIPDKNEWTVIFSKNLGVTDPSAYKPEENVLTLKVKPETHPATETFTIDLSDFTANSMVLALKWDKFRIPVKIEAAVKELVLSNTDKEIERFANSLTQAANYAFDNNDVTRGMKWLDESIALQETFLNLHLKSKYLAKDGKFNEAVALAERSLDMAKESKNDFYVSENEKNINEWRPKMSAVKSNKKK